MCTVSFLPGPEAGAFTFTSNRDETPGRMAMPPASFVHEGATWHGPRDPQAGGTWFGTDGRAFSLCVLNGAFVKHQHRPPYKRSRGLLIPHFLAKPDVFKFAATYDFEGMEPFTLLLIEHATTILKLFEMRWDEKELHLRALPVHEPQLWQSSTLYTFEQAAEREQWFTNWLNSHHPPHEHIMQFHQNRQWGTPETAICM
ncbi:MAG: NRDE family protein [Bacteroidia bacterium]